MKIRNRLTQILTITAIVAITVLSLVVYYYTAKFHEREFFSRLEERVAITELIFLENDKEIESAIRDRFLQTLDEENEYVISLKPSGIDSLKTLFPPNFAGLIMQENLVRFWQGERQGVGVHYHLPKGDFAVIVTAIDIFGQRKLNFLQKILLYGGLFAVILLVIVNRLALSSALRPLENTIKRASTINANRLDLRLPVEVSEDEIGKLASAFNNMMDRLQNSFEAQRMFVRNASHEIQNPLTALRGEAEVILQKPRSEEEYQEALQTIFKGATQMQGLIKQLLDLEKMDALSVLPDPEIFSFDDCLLESIDLFPSERFILNFELDENEHLVFGCKDLIQIALKNIIDNALKYSNDSPITIYFYRDENRQLTYVKDEGIGISQNDLDKIFHPFFRSNEAREKRGHGIGLALVKKILTLHEGEINYMSKPGVGTVVEISLPAVGEPLP